MKLYLVQHGDALPKETDPERRLSDKGRGDVQRMASFLGRSNVRVSRVIHSGKARAMETAIELSRVIGPGNIVEEADNGLAPNDATDTICDAITGWVSTEAGDIMIVGHLPYMGRLVSRLVCDVEDAGVVAFTPGTVACLECGNSSDDWALNWFFRPELMGT